MAIGGFDFNTFPTEADLDTIVSAASDHATAIRQLKSWRSISTNAKKRAHIDMLLKMAECRLQRFKGCVRSVSAGAAALREKYTLKASISSEESKVQTTAERLNLI